MDNKYKFHIVKNKIGFYNKVIKKLMKEYRLEEPQPTGNNIFQTNNLKLFTYLSKIGVIEGTEARTNRVQAELIAKDIKNKVDISVNESYDNLYHFSDTGAVVFHRNDIAKYLTDKYHARIIANKKYMFIYDFNYNIYKIDYGTTFETELNMMFGDLIDKRLTTEIMLKVWTFSGRQVTEDSLSWDNSHYINFVNGVFDINNMKLNPHDPEKYFFKSIIPYKYDVNAKCPNILELLSRIFNKDDIEKQLEWIGFCMTPGYNFKMINFYVGMSNSGKSTFFNILEHLVSKENTKHISPQDLKSEYNLAELYGKMINIGGDIGSDKIKHFNILRELSGNDIKTARRIYQSPFDFTNEAKLMFGCNEIPQFDDVQASYNRINIILCTNVFTKDDIRKFDISIYKTNEEMSGLINESIKAYKNTLKRGGFIKDDSDETARIHDLMTNRFWLWSTERLNWCDEKSGQMWMHELRENYYNWCKKNNIHIDLEPNAFTIKFRKEFKGYYYINEKIRGSRDNRKIAVLGVRTKNYYMLHKKS